MSSLATTLATFCDLALRSMLASPARFSSMPSQSPRQHSRTKQDLHQLNERASVRSCSRPSGGFVSTDVPCQCWAMID
eukprot:812813-Pelagomonas_calceolata.AAC.4